LTVLQDLLEDVKADLLIFFHYKGQEILHAALPMLPMGNKLMIQLAISQGSSKNWAEQLKLRNSLILNSIAEQHTDSISSHPLY
jgi:hypothetical protein